MGFWWSELTHPYHVFTEKGYEVEIFSPDGGKCEADGMSDPSDASGYSRTDLISQGFIHTPELKALVENTKKVAEIDVGRFDAIVVAGGQAPMFSFDKATALQQKFVEFYEAGKVASALCHGSGDPGLCQAVQRRVPGQGQDRHRLCQRRGRLRRQRGLELRHAAARTST